MSILTDGRKGDRVLLMGNDAIARGALEAGVNVVSGYPGTPSSEIVENLAKIATQRKLYVEWSVNEKVASEVAAAASFARLKSMVVMKQVGVNVASDFLLHLSEYGTRGGMVLVSCEDPGALSSTNEGESRPYAKMMEFPLLEPGDFQEAKEMMKWAFELSEAINNIVMVRSVTRLSHASGNVILGELPETVDTARFEYDGTYFDQMTGPIITVPGITDFLHQRQQGKLKKAIELFETSPFNTYSGPEQPELLIITSSACNLYCKEAISILALQDRVGLLKLGTTWPLPPRLLEKRLSLAENILVVEEVQPFMEDNIKALAVELGEKIRLKRFYGKKDGTLPSTNELNPDRIIAALSKILNLDYQGAAESYFQKADAIAEQGAPKRDLTFCPGCPHRASFWVINSALKMDNRKGFICGDIGCYTLGILPTGFNTLKTGHAMGSGLGIASGFGKLGLFGMNQPVMAICGDSTFFHATIPALVNAVHNKSDLILVIVDNSGTAMTGFQPHPGLNRDTFGDPAPQVDIPSLCETIGAKVEICDPFDVEKTRQTLLGMMAENKGVRVVVMRQSCALSPEKKAGRMYEMAVDEALCKGDSCGCAKLCTRVFKCPGLNWDEENQVTRIDEVICTGCGVCASICPVGALQATPV
ncbi:MAG: 4Fe-4S binding protein [Deltaproteobacteria bacterium]|nr:4Fe-4S binding protein [Deltaproteobacteria bacterium]